MWWPIETEGAPVPGVGVWSTIHRRFSRVDASEDDLAEVWGVKYFLTLTPDPVECDEMTECNSYRGPEGIVPTFSRWW